jgi:hypothetical protein
MRQLFTKYVEEFVNAKIMYNVCSTQHGEIPSVGMSDGHVLMEQLPIGKTAATVSAYIVLFLLHSSKIRDNDVIVIAIGR